MTINFEKLSPRAKDVDKAIMSLREELEAINIYNMRAEQADDPELKAILLHNMGEEVEHATMLSEWLRRNVERFDHEFKDYLFTSGSLTALEAEGGKSEAPVGDNGLGIGNLK